MEISETANKKFQFRRFFSSLFLFPRWQDAALSLLSAILLILAFPDFEIRWLAWFAFVPLLIAIERNKDSATKSFWLGWLQGTVFFYGTCWWLTYAPINYGGIPAPLVYLLLVPATLGAGFFTAIFAAVLSRFLKRFGSLAILLAPFVWTACEFLRHWITGNSWNALGYSQAFVPSAIRAAEYGGVFSIGFLLIFRNALIFYAVSFYDKLLTWRHGLPYFGLALLLVFFSQSLKPSAPALSETQKPSAVVVALQPNVPMSGLQVDDYYSLRERHVEMAEKALREIENKTEYKDLPRIVVFPESPMNFAYANDSEFREFVQDFGARNNVSLLFNAGEPSTLRDGYHNSAVMVNRRGEKIAQYDKIRLVPFGEYVPEFIPGQEFLPTVVGRMKPGKDFRLMPFADVRAGVMICFESAFGDVSRNFVLNGADVLVELTNDGYGGDTPIIRQHLANAVFRAVETNRPVLRVTNVGTTAYINERGEISDATNDYEIAARVWTISKSNGEETFYVKYGDWFAVLCTVLSFIFLGLTFLNRKKAVQ
ncbi:MAG TPA: apolipoprotein N-acyltransferase [Pyrinomonadaceae bacterium]|jgi:apolipoprotein N-acyltransferase